jgi:hypothetical protein
MSRMPPDALPRPPGCWTAWPASITTLQPNDFMIGIARMSTTRFW